MVVNHNMASICESRQLRYNVKKMEVSSKKLATGYKIIGANDDAAGLQISETMRHQTRGLNKASRNSQDGISMLQTADAALQETQDVLGRMVELTTQAANDTHTDADRRSIQDELDPSQLEALANKGHWILRAGDICCLRHQPSRIVKCHRIPMGRHFSLIHLPVRILNLERKIRRKHSGHLH